MIGQMGEQLNRDIGNLAACGPGGFCRPLKHRRGTDDELRLSRLTGKRRVVLCVVRAHNTFDVSPVRLGFDRAFKNMRGDATFLQRFAELDA